MTMDEQEKLARHRLMQLNVVRMFGIVSVVFAALNISGKILPDLSPYLGYVLLLNGAVDILVFPALMKKNWIKQG
jgi:hypothetical protein